MFRIRRAFLATRNLYVPCGRLLTKAPTIRSFSTSLSSTKSSLTQKTAALVSTLGLTGFLFWTKINPPELRKSKRLFNLAVEGNRKGDNDQAKKYFTEAFAVSKHLFKSGTYKRFRPVLLPILERLYFMANTVISMIDTVVSYGACLESFGQHDVALPLYSTAMEHVKLLPTLSARCGFNMVILSHMAECYRRMGKLEATKRTYRKAIKVYGKYKGRASLEGSQPHQDDSLLQEKISICIINIAQHDGST